MCKRFLVFLLALFLFFSFSFPGLAVDLGIDSYFSRNNPFVPVSGSDGVYSFNFSPSSFLTKPDHIEIWKQIKKDFTDDSRVVFLSFNGFSSSYSPKNGGYISFYSCDRDTLEFAEFTFNRGGVDIPGYGYRFHNSYFLGFGISSLGSPIPGSVSSGSFSSDSSISWTSYTWQDFRRCFWLPDKYSSYKRSEPYFLTGMKDLLLFDDLPSVSHSLTIEYVDENGTPLMDSFSQSYDEGESYSVESPVIEGYTPDKPIVSGVMGNGDLIDTVVYRRDSYTVTVNYVDGSGDVISDPYIHDFYYGDSYSIESPLISGYTPDRPVVSGVMGNSDIDITVTYSFDYPGDSYSLTIQYLDSDGSQISPPNVHSIVSGSQYEFFAPSIIGYSPVESVLRGTMPENDFTISFTYSSSDYLVTIKHIFSDGSPALDDSVHSVPFGSSYRFEAPALSGYRPSKSFLSGVMPNEDLTLYFTYFPDSGGGSSRPGFGDGIFSDPFSPPFLDGPSSFPPFQWGGNSFTNPFLPPSLGGDSSFPFFDWNLGDFSNPFIPPSLDSPSLWGYGSYTNPFD